MTRTAAPLVILTVIAFVVAWFAVATPAPEPADAPLDRFAAGRAIVDVQAMATLPHPNGSPQNAIVRDQLVARLTGLGLAPEVERVEDVKPMRGTRPPRTVENVVAVVKGADAAKPAVLVISHYDSVPFSPGAADDMAGVSSGLEIIRLLHQRGEPARDVIFLFSDGEEMGLLGAKAFAENSPLIDHVGFVVDMEARGGGGRALMFETGPDNGDVARFFAHVAIHPQSNSLDDYLYRIMPNDTDFTITRKRGIVGLNFAFIERPEQYHSPRATPDKLELGALQSMGEQAWAAVGAAAYADELPSKGPDAAWSDIYGAFVVVYPAAFGWAFILASAALLFATYFKLAGSAAFSIRQVANGAWRSLAATFLATGLLALIWQVGAIKVYRGLQYSGALEWAIALCIAATVLVVSNFIRSESGGHCRWLGAAGFCLVIAVVLQIIAPPTAFTIEWVTLAGSLALFLHNFSNRIWGWAGAFIASAAGLAYLFPTGHFFSLGIGTSLPMAVAVMLPLVFTVIGVWAECLRPKFAYGLGSLFVVAALVLAVTIRLGPTDFDAILRPAPSADTTKPPPQ